jgi:hypothetical protein
MTNLKALYLTLFLTLAHGAAMADAKVRITYQSMGGSALGSSWTLHVKGSERDNFTAHMTQKAGQAGVQIKTRQIGAPFNRSMVLELEGDRAKLSALQADAGAYITGKSQGAAKASSGQGSSFLFP